LIGGTEGPTVQNNAENARQLAIAAPSWIEIEVMRIPLTRIGLASGLLAGAIARAAAPELKPTAIVSAADHRGGSVSPGEILVLYPSNAGPAALMGQTPNQEGRLLTIFGETRVLFDGQAAPVLYAVQGEISVVAPFELAGRTSTNVVVEYQGNRSEPVTIPVVASKPALFTQNRIGTGEAGVLNDTGCCNSAANPAARGSLVAVYATGAGVYQGNVPTGAIAASKDVHGYPRPSQPVQLTVGGVRAELSFVGAAPHSVAGLLQINFRVPETAPLGNVPLVLSVGESESRSLATMVVRSEKSRILLASLDSATRKDWADRLSRAGYEPVQADSLGPASALASQAPIDLAIVDMPKTGDSPASWITSLPPNAPGMKVLVIAAETNADSLRKADLLGANGFVERGAPASTVLERIGELVRKRPVAYDAGPPWPVPEGAAK
jgi:uncharacterized protein (TIGR03437 family)